MKKRISTIIITLLFILTLGIVASACETSDTYTVKFDTNCGSGEMQSCTAKHGELIESPYDSESLSDMLEGYFFVGWYKPNGERWSELMPITESMTLTARWHTAYYGIYYDLNGGQSAGDNPKYFTVEDEIVFNPAIKRGYKFEGWTSKQIPGTPYVRKIEKGTHINIRLMANWSGDGNDYIISSDCSHAIYNGYT